MTMFHSTEGESKWSMHVVVQNKDRRVGGCAILQQTRKMRLEKVFGVNVTDFLATQTCVREADHKGENKVPPGYPKAKDSKQRNNK